MSDSERQRFLANIAMDAERLSRLVRRMMELAKADMRVVDGTEHTDAATTLAKLADGYRHATFAVQMEFPQPLPDVRMAPAGLETIAATLIDNARQAGASALAIRASQQEDQVAIHFTDNGSGVAEGDRARLFEPFFTSKRHSGGTGMGLSIARSLAEAHGGHLDLVANETGACFALILPVYS